MTNGNAEKERMMRYILRVIDFETTGIPTDDVEHSVCEYGFVDVDAATKEILQAHGGLVKPSTDMDIEALATHHISERDAMQNGIGWDAAQNILLREKAGEGVEIIFVAHNADYEKKFFNPDSAKWIDTYKVALKLYPDAPRHTNQVLKYYLGIADATHHHPPHRALPDCQVSAEILLKMSKEMTFNEMIHISKQPPFLTKISFGKHKGERFDDLPYDYCQWLSRQTDMDEGVKAAVARRLDKGF